jgi:hypothetical protein
MQYSINGVPSNTENKLSLIFANINPKDTGLTPPAFTWNYFPVLVICMTISHITCSSAVGHRPSLAFTRLEYADCMWEDRLKQEEGKKGDEKCIPNFGRNTWLEENTWQTYA